MKGSSLQVRSTGQGSCYFSPPHIVLEVPSVQYVTKKFHWKGSYKTATATVPFNL